MKTTNLKKQTFSKCAQLLTLSLLLAIPAWVQGQNWKTAGNNAMATDFLGTNNAQDLRIRTNGTQKLVITTGGNVGIGTATPAAKLDVIGQVKITDGTQGAGKVLTSDAAGLASWQTPASGSADAWSRLGNAGTVDGTHFLGTTDNVPLNFRVNNQKAGRIDPTLFNTFIGYQSGNSNPTGGDNTATGASALYSNTSGTFNTANGAFALYSNTIGTYNTANGVSALNYNTTGNSNTASGFMALVNNTTGNENTATGNKALFSNTTGYRNTANGVEALVSNTTGYQNQATGYRALYSNTTGHDNAAFGNGSLINNTTGDHNSATGQNALYSNTTGAYNAANGVGALDQNTTGNENSATGAFALHYNISGSFNTAVGYFAGNANLTAPSNFTALGYNAGQVASNSNTIEIGNTSVTWIGGQVGWSTYSDKRIKDNVQSNVPGLSFITRLNPVTYNLNIHRENEICGINDTKEWEGKYDIEKITQTGFLAQEVEQAAKECNYDFNGVQAPKDNAKLYSVQYASFVVPLVKAVQELNENNKVLQTENKELKNEIEQIKAAMNLEQRHQLNEIKSPVVKNALVEQNIPNPFNESTSIRFSISSNFNTAQLLIYSSQGVKVKAYEINQKAGSITVDANTLSPGIYSYTLIVDHSAADVKQMIVTQ